MDGYSVKDQYCNPSTDNWHETVFIGTEECSENSWSSQSIDLTFTTDGCEGGVSLKKCSYQPCKKQDSKYKHEHNHAQLIARLLEEKKT